VDLAGVEPASRINRV